MIFNIDDFRNFDFVMHCKTEQESKEFCDYMHNIGETWADGTSYKERNPFEYYGYETCFNFNNNRCGFLSHYAGLTNQYVILKWSDFDNNFTKKNLKDGMVVEFRNGSRRMVLNGRLIAKDRYAPLSSYTDELKESSGYKHEDIVKVYKSNSKLLKIDRLLSDDNLILIGRINTDVSNQKK